MRKSILIVLIAVTWYLYRSRAPEAIFHLDFSMWVLGLECAFDHFQELRRQEDVPAQRTRILTPAIGVLLAGSILATPAQVTSTLLLFTLALIILSIIDIDHLVVNGRGA